MRFPSVLAAAALVSSVFFACGEEDTTPIPKKGTAGGGSAGAAGKPGSEEGRSAVGGACTGPRMNLVVAKQNVAIDCDVWRGPHAMIEVFEGLDKCCTVKNREDVALYESFTPQLAFVYAAIAYQWQQDITKGAISVDIAAVERCEAAVAAARPAIAACQGGVDVIALATACSDLVVGVTNEGNACSDTDSCAGTARCVGERLADNSEVNKKCIPPKGTGEFCQEESSTPSIGTLKKPLCLPGNVCVENACVAQLEEGGQCLFDASCKSGRCASTRCAPALPAKIAVDQPCFGPTDCVQSAKCIGGTCIEKGSEGKACTQNGDACLVFCATTTNTCTGLYCGIDRF